MFTARLNVKLAASVKCFLFVILLYSISVCFIFNCILEFKHDSDLSSSGSDVSIAQTKVSRDVYKLQWNSKEKVFFKKVRSVGNTRTSGLNSTNKEKRYKNRHHVRVTKDFHIFSAFLDNRLSVPYIRILSTLKKYSDDIKQFSCHFQLSGSSLQHKAYVSTKLSYYEMCENHNRPIGGWILSCVVPQEVTPLAQSVKISRADVFHKQPANATTVFITKVIYPKNATKSTQKQLIGLSGICVPPLYGTIQPKAFIEFIELSRLLGVDKIIFYVFEIQPEIQKILNYYTSLEYIDAFSWELPFHQKAVWNYGQSLAVNDCLYRYMNEFDYLAFLDIDEALIPHTTGSTWKHILLRIYNASQSDFSNYSGFSFRSTFFDPVFSRTAKSKEAGIIAHVNRSKHFSFFRNKVLVRPMRIFELGIHHVSRSWPDEKNYTVAQVEPSIAAIHHYRTCISEFGMNCKLIQEDLTVPLKFGRQLNKNIIRRMLKIRR